MLSIHHKACLAITAVLLAACGNGASDSLPAATLAAQAQALPHTATQAATSAPSIADTATATAAVPTAPSPEPDLPPGDRDAEAESATHTVVAGDSLTRIADRYGISMRSLLAANDLPNPDLLEVGQVIQLPQTPVAYTSGLRLLPDARLVRSVGASAFDIERFIQNQPGALKQMTLTLERRRADGSVESSRFSAGDIVERVSLEYSVDARILLAFLDYFAGLLSQTDVAEDIQLKPLQAQSAGSGPLRLGLYNQLSWLADALNRGYYDWKYRGETILEFPDGTRLLYHRELNAGTVALHYVLAQLLLPAAWETAISADGIAANYQRHFGDAFAGSAAPVPRELIQPPLTLPFARGEVWRFTGGFHGGWGNGSAWAAIDFAPPPQAGPTGACYVAMQPALAVADGVIARLAEGLVVLDLDDDADESSGWTILYLHIDAHDALQTGQAVSAGNILGYPSCSGGFSTATHLHIARRYNGEWLPADCNRCPEGRNPPPFVMSGWRVVGLSNQLYQGFMVRDADNHTVVAEQGRFTDVNAISW